MCKLPIKKKKIIPVHLSYTATYPSQWTVQVEPKFHEDASKLEELVPFEECIELHSSEKAVVRAPEYLLLTHNGRSFKSVSITSPFLSLL